MDVPALEQGRSSNAARCPNEVGGRAWDEFRLPWDEFKLPWGNSPADTRLSMEPIGLQAPLDAEYIMGDALLGSIDAVGMPG